MSTFTIVVKTDWRNRQQEMLCFPDRLSAGRMIWEMYQSYSQMNDLVEATTAADAIGVATMWVTGMQVKADAGWAKAVELGVSDTHGHTSPVYTYAIAEAG
jgi:hypothetical protein